MSHKLWEQRTLPVKPQVKKWCSIYWQQHKGVLLGQFRYDREGTTQNEVTRACAKNATESVVLSGNDENKVDPRIINFKHVGKYGLHAT